jgi:hypothetical protein
MNKLRETYINKANNLYSRLLGEAPEDEEVTDEITTGEETGEEGDVENTEETPEEDDSERGQSEQVEIFFNSLDEETQKTLLDALKQNLNVAEEDDFANQKIIDALVKEPIVAIRAEELVRKLNIDI